MNYCTIKTMEGRTSMLIITGLVITFMLLAVPVSGIDYMESYRYYSEECDYLTPDELSKLDFTMADPC